MTVMDALYLGRVGNSLTGIVGSSTYIPRLSAALPGTLTDRPTKAEGRVDLPANGVHYAVSIAHIGCGSVSLRRNRHFFLPACFLFCFVVGRRALSLRLRLRRSYAHLPANSPITGSEGS